MHVIINEFKLFEKQILRSLCIALASRRRSCVHTLFKQNKFAPIIISLDVDERTVAKNRTTQAVDIFIDIHLGFSSPHRAPIRNGTSTKFKLCILHLTGNARAAFAEMDQRQAR